MSVLHLLVSFMALKCPYHGHGRGDGVSVVSLKSDFVLVTIPPQLTDMHHLFRVDEILRSIASHIVDTGHYESALSLACCCTTISAPTLDVMWEGQTNFVTALKTLPPSSVWEVTGRTLVSPSHGFLSDAI